MPQRINPLQISRISAATTRAPLVRATAADFGANVGEAVAELGRAGAAAARQIGDAAEERELESAKQFVSNELTSLYERQAVGSDEAQRQAVGPATGYFDGRKTNFQTDVDEVLKRAPSERAKTLFNKTAGTLWRSRFVSQESGFEAMSASRDRRIKIKTRIDAIHTIAQTRPEDYAIQADLLTNLINSAKSEMLPEAIAALSESEPKRLADIAIQGALANGNYRLANQLLEGSAGQTDSNGNVVPGRVPLSPERRQILSAKLDEHLNESANLALAQDTTDEIMVKGLSRTESLKTARALEDPKLRDAVVKRIDLRHDEVDAARDDKKKADEEGAWASIEKGATPDDFPVALRISLDSKTLSSMQARSRQLRRGEEPVTDDTLDYELSRQAADDPQAFVKRNLLNDRPRLDDGRWRHHVNLQRKMASEDDKGVRAQHRTRTQMVNQALRAIGLDPSSKKRASTLR